MTKENGKKQILKQNEKNSQQQNHNTPDLYFFLYHFYCFYEYVAGSVVTQLCTMMGSPLRGSCWVKIYSGLGDRKSVSQELRYCGMGNWTSSSELVITFLGNLKVRVKHSYVIKHKQINYIFKGEK